MTSYYGKYLNGGTDFTSGMARRDTDAALVNLLGIDANQPIKEDELSNLLSGLRADGKEIEGRSRQGSTDDKARISYIDLVFSAPKSLSIAMALAPTESERAILDRAHRDAVDSTMEFIAKEIGLARRGKAGSKGADVGHVTWFQFDHYASRPTTMTAVEENGVGDTVVQQVPVTGDPNRHTHTVMPNVVLTDEERVGSLHWKKTQGRIHEWGAIYQAYLGNNLRRGGVEFDLDQRTLMGTLTAVPQWVNELYSKFHRNGEEAAQEHARQNGVDWELLTGKARVAYLRGATSKIRQAKGEGLADYENWLKQAAEAGYRHRSVLRPGEERELEARAKRLPKAFDTFLPILDPNLQRVSVFDGSVARIAAAKSLIATGIGSPDDVGTLTRAARELGVQQQGEMTPLIWGKVGDSQFYHFTTGRHVEQEKEAIALLSAAAADRSSALTPREVEAAVRKVELETGLDFSTGHGKEQRGVIERLGTGGRAAVAIGVAGAGKTSLLIPLVRAWHDAGRDTIGVTLAWRQTHALADAGVGKRRRKSLKPDTRQLTDAGIAPARAYALAALLRGMDRGVIQADANTVVVVDEIAQLGTKQVVDLARLQAQHGFQIVGLGDGKQCQSIEAGNTIRLFQKSLGAEQVPELLNTVRQITERDRETSLLFREGKAAEALARKDEDGTLKIVPGGYKQAVQAAVDLWQQRAEANAATPGYSVGISAPTNADARAVGTEMRARRQAAGAVSKQETMLRAIDQTGVEYGLPVAAGDRVRLFNRVHATYPHGKASRFGDNGSVVEVVAVGRDGMNMRSSKGHVAFVPWDQLRDEITGRIRLTYGDALTIDARQGDTLTEHITVMPAGSQAVNGFKAYTADSRQRVQSWLVTSQGEEQAEIEARRPLGDPRNQITARAKVKAAIIENMARNFSRQPEKQLATDFLSMANHIRKGAVRAMQSAWHRQERRQRGGQRAIVAPAQLVERQEVATVKAATAAVKGQQKAVMDAARKARSVLPRRPARSPKSEAEIVAEFADVLHRLGLKLQGSPIMDGKIHNVPVDGNKRGRKSGGYIGHLDGTPAGWARNRLTGNEVRWRASASTKPMSDEERRARQREIEEKRAVKAGQRKAREERVAGIAERVWNAAMPAVRHDYLQRKDVMPHWARQDRRGNLLVPMQDADGRIWNLQTIKPDGTKLFGVVTRGEDGKPERIGGRKQGLYAVIGGLEWGKPVAIAEGFATAATITELAGLPSIVAFDSGNLRLVAQAIRAEDQSRQIVFAADNDHHLPRRSPPLPNIGVGKAHEAAREVGGVVLAPKFESHESGTDWNDYAAQHGRRVTIDHLRQSLAELGVPTPTQERSQGRGRGL